MEVESYRDTKTTYQVTTITKTTSITNTNATVKN